MYHIPSTGQRPITFSAQGLPTGLALDPATGNITGSSADAGTHAVIFTATNPLGSVSVTFTIVIGDSICLTPPLGWTSWKPPGSTKTRTRRAMPIGAWIMSNTTGARMALQILQEPYAQFRQSLDKINRDIVYSLCQYGMGDVWIKPLADGATAVAFFVRATSPATISLAWSDLKLSGPAPVRDLWRQKDEKSDDSGISATVSGHGAELVRVGPAKQ